VTILGNLHGASGGKSGGREDREALGRFFKDIREIQRVDDGI